MRSSPQLVIVGDSAIAEVAYEYFTHDSDYTVAAFAVEAAYYKSDSLFGLPVVPFETLEASHPPADYDVFVAVGYGQLNRVRERLFQVAKAKGYRLASYVSSQAFVWRNVTMGENCFVFENNVIQPFVTIGDNVILWSGNHIGHHSTIGSHCFISSHVVVSGFVTVGNHCFLGVNATLINNITIADDCWIGPGVTLLRDTTPGSFYKPERITPAKVDTHTYFKLDAEPAHALADRSS